MYIHGLDLLVCVSLAAVAAAGCASTSVFVQNPHLPLADDAIAVTEPGNCDKPGATYVLANDITSDRTALFLARDVTLDLNGYTITYAAGGYEHLPNGGFEDGLAGWDTSKAPRARVLECGGSWPFTGKKIMRLRKDDQIVSSYMTLPVANRSYYAVCGVLDRRSTVTISVEDEDGRPIDYAFRVADRSFQTCPVTAHGNLDGGFVYAHFRNTPAGRYRVRIKAHANCLIDGVDIRPAIDAGIAIVGRTWIYSEYKQVVVDKHMPCFTDYTVEGSDSRPVDSIATAAGNTEITIRNGTIRNGFDGIQMWGIQAVGAGGVIRLENLRIISSGINTNAVYVPHAIIRNCRFETDTPFIIERHSLKNSPVAINDSRGSEVAGCQFIGGQGNLCFRGKGGKVHDNLFVNRQRVTNHYALSLASAEGVEVYDNRFEPDIGCGINIYRSRDNDVHDNFFLVKACDRSCAQYYGAGTIVGVRISDYADRPNSPRGTWGNKVHHNTFRVVGKRFRTFRRRPAGRACAIFSSTGAGTNYVYDNDITIEHADPDSSAMAVAFYIGASPNAGEYTNNRIVSNVTPIYLAVSYGDAGRAILRRNTIVKSAPAADDFQPFAMGYREARDIEFRSNVLEGCDFGIRFGDTGPRWRQSDYALYWTLELSVVDKDGRGAAGLEVTIKDKDGNVAERRKTDAAGRVSVELLEYKAVVTKPAGEIEIDKTYCSPYTVQVAGLERTVELNDNKRLTVRLPK